MPHTPEGSLISPSSASLSTRPKAKQHLPTSRAHDHKVISEPPLSPRSTHKHKHTRWSINKCIGDDTQSPRYTSFYPREQPVATLIACSRCADDETNVRLWRTVTRTVAAEFGRHGMPPPASNDTGTALRQHGSDWSPGLATLTFDLGGYGTCSNAGRRPPSVYSPLTSTWPHLRCDVGLEEGEYRETIYVLQYSVLL